MSNNDKFASLTLSLHPDEENVVSSVKKMMLEEELLGFEPLNEGKVDVKSSYIFDNGDEIEVGVFFRNASDKDLQFSSMPLSLIDENGNVVASEIFELDDLGEVPSCSGRPHKMFFKKCNMTNDGEINENCTVVFSENIKTMNVAQIEYEGIENIPFEMQMFLKQSLATLPPIEKGQIDLTPYEVYMEGENKVKVTFLIRNGREEKFTLSQLPISIYDNDDKTVHSTVLEVNGLELGGNKAKLFSFVIDCGSKDLSEFNLANLHMEFKA